MALVLPALLDITPTVLPRLSEVGFDAGVVAFTVVLVVLVTLAVGILPALRASRTDTATKGWLGAMALVALVAVQMALAFVLIAATGLAMRAVGDLRGRDVGINPAGLLSADVYLPREPYVTRNVSGAGSAEIAEFSPAGAALYDRIRAALQTTPGVVQAAGVGTRPFAVKPVRAVLDRGPGTHARQPGRGAVPGRHGKLLQHGGDSRRSWPRFLGCRSRPTRRGWSS